MEVKRERKSPAKPDQKFYSIPKGKFSSQIIQDEQKDDKISSEDKKPVTPVVLLTLDIEVQPGKTEALIVHEGDNPEDISTKFCNTHNMQDQFIEYIAQQIKENLSKIK